MAFAVDADCVLSPEMCGFKQTLKLLKIGATVECVVESVHLRFV